MSKRKYKSLTSGRADKTIAADTGLSRNQISHLINCKSITVDGEVLTKASKNIRIDQEIEVDESKIAPPDLVAEDLDLEIVYEDKFLVVVNKRNDLVVHPAPGNPNGTIVNGLMHQIVDFDAINGTLRPGVVHRIDKQTTGLLVFAKNQETTQKLSEMFKNKEVKREYYAIVRGQIGHKRGKIDAPIGRASDDRKKMEVTAKNSKKSVTNFEVIEQFEDFALIKCVLETGRTHQIRVHLNYINHPILGDNKYGLRVDRKHSFGQFLHARTLGFKHPITGEEMEFTSELPKEFKDMLEEIK